MPHRLLRHLLAVLGACLSAPLSVAAAEPRDAPLAEAAAKAIADAGAGKPEACAECEAVLALSPRIQPEQEKAYWGLIRSSGDYPRAYAFFTTLAAQRPGEAEAVACAGCATGGYIGWLFSHQLGSHVTAQMRAAALDDFASARRLDADNLSALTGQIVYDAMSPPRHGQVHGDLAALEDAAQRHPERPEYQQMATAMRQLADGGRP